MHPSGWQLIAALALAHAACRDPAQTSAEPAAVPSPDPPPPIEVSTARSDLLFGYSLDGGRTFETAASIAEVPESARSAVVVTDLSLTPDQRQAGRYIYLADLRTSRNDGTYPVSLASRYGFEIGRGGTSTASSARTGGVVLYSTSWCGVCKRARRFLHERGVPFEEKDVEASRSAREELAAKAALRGIEPSAVPVIDVGGVLLQGLDERTLTQVLTERGLLKN